ncbi:hypothetical protein EDB86DRAFT_3088033 [Lactarius hatsudake]|nr:hypothetical protein EDB86DRAFT_3088033 [Lactarius hatsudake]
MASNALSFPATQHFSAFSFGDILGNSNNNDFTATGTSDEHLDLTSALVSPHIAPGLLPHSQPVVSGQVGGTLQGSDTPTYARLAYMYQQREHQFQHLTRDYNSLRTSHEELTKSHKKVLDAYIEASNTLTTRNQESDHNSTQSLGSPEAGPSTQQLMKPLVRSDYPLVKFWTKLAWKIYSDTINDSSNLVPGDNRRGRTRSAQGINVMMLYIENADGTSIDGIVAGQIRDFAHSIWHRLLLRKAAPDKWGDAPSDVREHYYYDMEVKYEVLRYCEGHWKAQAVATSIYSQWHSTFVKKRGATVKEEENADTVQATTKKPRLASSNDVSESPSFRENVAGIMPKGITPIDPLYRSYTYRPILIYLHEIDCSTDVFDDPSLSGFSLFETVPDVIPTPTLDPGTNGESPATGVTDSASPAPSPATETVSPGPASVTLPAPTTIETQVGSSPTSTSTQDTPVVSETSPSPHTNASGPTLSSSATSPSAATTGKRVEKKYACNKRMIPGGAKSARNICARDWCISHPEGTKGDFARYWDTLDAGSKAVFKQKEVDAKASAKAAVSK